MVTRARRDRNAGIARRVRTPVRTSKSCRTWQRARRLTALSPPPVGLSWGPRGRRCFRKHVIADRPSAASDPCRRQRVESSVAHCRRRPNGGRENVAPAAAGRGRSASRPSRDAEGCARSHSQRVRQAKASSPADELILHYDILKPHHKRFGSHAADPSTAVLYSAQAITFFTLKTTPERLAAQLDQRIASHEQSPTKLRSCGRCTKTTGSSPTGTSGGSRLSTSSTT